MSFGVKEKLMLQIYGSKRSSFPTQEFGRKMVFLYYLQNLHDILRNKKDDISVLKNDKIILYAAQDIMFTDY